LKSPLVADRLAVKMDVIQREIAGINFSISSRTTGIVQDDEPAYEPFSGKRADKQNPDADLIHIDIELVGGDMPAIFEPGKREKIFDSGQSWSMYHDAEEDVYLMVLHPAVVDEPFWAARFTRDPAGVTVYCGPQLVKEAAGRPMIVNPVRYPLDQVLLMYTLARRQGAVIHAAGMEIDGKGFIFAGPSGAGKSTLARLFNASVGQNHSGASVLSDERMVARKINGTFKAYGTPWHGEEGSTRNKCSPLSGIFFLSHGKENRVKPLNPRQALERLLKVTSIPWYDRGVMPGILDFCEDLLTNVPLFEFHFTPGIEAVRFLETVKVKYP
jgi:hypothetical protein